MTSFSSWSDFNSQGLLEEKLRKDKEQSCVSCVKCGGQWFEEVRVQQFQEDHHVIVGQPVPPRPGSVPYILLRCIHCQALLEPRVQNTTRDLAGKHYDSFLDTVEGKLDKRKETPDGIPTEKL